MTIHILKTDAEPYDDIAAGRKRFDIRRDDRTPRFEADDLVVFVKPGTADRRVFRIGYVYRGQHLSSKFCAFELDVPKAADEAIAGMVLGGVNVSK